MRSAQAIGALTDPVYDLIRVTRRDRWWLWVSFIFAASAHCALGWVVTHRLSSRLPPRSAITSDLFDIDLPVPAEVKAPPESVPETAPAPKAKTREPRAAKEPPPPSLAQAAAVVTRQDDPNAPVDLTGFVVGTATAYAGGTTASTGTSTRAVQTQAHVAGTLKRTGTVGDGATADKSRPPSVLGELNWNCPFPLEADIDRINNAIATIRVAVDAADKITRVDVLQDPAHGFGEAARRCAKGKSWRAARNREGMPTAGSVTVRVRFVR
jgi:protein TonB